MSLNAIQSLDSSDDERWMQEALLLAKRGEGSVEPNPMVGCVIVRGNTKIGEGWHERFGGPHAEVNALRSLADPSLAETTVYVTLEPCCHVGKTPPCVDLFLKNPPKRIVVAMEDPFPQVRGKGIARLRDIGVPVDVGVCHEQARELLAPYLKKTLTKMPWVIGKWAMSLDGKIATRTGSSQWISNELSRREVHRLRGRVDAIMVGIGTAMADDPLLTARPPGPRTPIRVLLDTHLRLPLTSKLVQTSREAPVVIGCRRNADPEKIETLKAHGCECLILDDPEPSGRLREIMLRLSEKGCTNVLVEGGSELFGSLADLAMIDELHLFMAPIVIGGRAGASPIAGLGIDKVVDGTRWRRISNEWLQDDLYVVYRSQASTLRQYD